MVAGGAVVLFWDTVYDVNMEQNAYANLRQDWRATSRSNSSNGVITCNNDSRIKNILITSLLVSIIELQMRQNIH